MALRNNVEPLSKEEMLKIHDATIKLLGESGVVFKSEQALEIFKDHGARVEGQTVYIPQKMVERSIMLCPSTFTYRGRNAAQTITIGEGFAIQPNTGPVDIQDMDNGRRPGTLQDYINIQKMCQASDVVKITGANPIATQDVPPDERHLKMIYETIRHTDKPLMNIVLHGEQARQVLKMVEIAFGEEDVLSKHHVIGVSVNPLSPMAYGPEDIETMIAYAENNQPVFILPCIMAGISGPISLLGTVVQQNAEILAGTVLLQLVNPEIPVVHTPSSTVGDLSKGEYITGTPEAFLINAANLQISSQMYKVPTRIMCGMTDSDSIDCQAGYETEQNMMMGMLTRANILHNCLGILDSMMVTSYEKFVIDEELFRRFFRISQGLEVTDELLALDVIQEVTKSGGNFLTHESTFKHCRDLWQPSVSFRGRHKRILQSGGSEDLIAVANKKYKKILEECPDKLIEEALDQELQGYLQTVLPVN